MKKIVIYIFILLSNIVFAQEKSNLIFKKSIYSVKLEFENNNNFIELNKDNTIQIITKNIDPVNMMVSGIGVKIANKTNFKNKTNYIITPTIESVKDGFYILNISFRGKKGRLHNNQFLIRIKE